MLDGHFLFKAITSTQAQSGVLGEMKYRNAKSKNYILLLIIPPPAPAPPDRAGEGQTGRGCQISPPLMHCNSATL